MHRKFKFIDICTEMRQQRRLKMSHQREREVRVECDRRQGTGLLQEWGNGK